MSGIYGVAHALTDEPLIARLGSTGIWRERPFLIGLTCGGNAITECFSQGDGQASVCEGFFLDWKHSDGCGTRWTMKLDFITRDKAYSHT